ncbi:hypothetical protein ACJX0J_037440 [Zea mays]
MGHYCGWIVPPPIIATCLELVNFVDANLVKSIIPNKEEHRDDKMPTVISIESLVNLWALLFRLSDPLASLIQLACYAIEEGNILSHQFLWQATQINKVRGGTILSVGRWGSLINNISSLLLVYIAPFLFFGNKIPAVGAPTVSSVKKDTKDE